MLAIRIFHQFRFSVHIYLLLAAEVIPLQAVGGVLVESIGD